MTTVLSGHETSDRVAALRAEAAIEPDAIVPTEVT